MKKKSKVESLTSKQIEEITNKAEKRKNVPLVKSGQINMRVSEDLLRKAKRLARAQKMPYTTFLGKLLREDIERLWAVFDK